MPPRTDVRGKVVGSNGPGWDGAELVSSVSLLPQSGPPALRGGMSAQEYSVAQTQRQ